MNDLDVYLRSQLYGKAKSVLIFLQMSQSISMEHSELP